MGLVLLCRAGCGVWAGHPTAHLASGTGLTGPQGLGLGFAPDGAGLAGACRPHAALSFGQELPVRVACLWPKHPVVLCCRLRHARSHAWVQRD